MEVDHTAMRLASLNRPIFPVEDESPTFSVSDKDEILPVEYRPTKCDVISGRGRKSYNHIANRRFRQLTAMNLKRYQNARCKVDKTLVVIGIVNSIRMCSPCGGFVKKCANRWLSMSDEEAREKVGHCLRDMIASNRESPRRTIVTADGKTIPTTNPKSPLVQRPAPYHNIVNKRTGEILDNNRNKLINKRGEFRTIYEDDATPATSSPLSQSPQPLPKQRRRLNHNHNHLTHSTNATTTAAGTTPLSSSNSMDMVVSQHPTIGIPHQTNNISNGSNINMNMNHHLHHHYPFTPHHSNRGGIPKKKSQPLKQMEQVEEEVVVVEEDDDQEDESISSSQQQDQEEDEQQRDAVFYTEDDEIFKGILTMSDQQKKILHKLENGWSGSVTELLQITAS